MAFDSKQQQILDAAKTLFGEKGYESTSVRDIAELAETNAASINYYFGSKEALFKVISSTSMKNTHKIIGILNENPESIDGLKVILKNFFKLFVQLRSEDASTYFFINRNIDLLIELDPETFKKDIWVVMETLTTLIASAKKNKLLQKTIQPEIFASVLFSSLSHLFRDENIHCKFGCVSTFDDEYRNNFINHVINGFIDGVKEKP